MSKSHSRADDARWRAWMQGLPSPAHPEPQAAKTYLLSMAQALENRPAPIDRLLRKTKLLLTQCLALHYDIIAYELDRAAYLVEVSSLGETAGEAATILGSISPEARMGSAAVKFVAGRGRKGREARLRELQKLALGVRNLLISLRQSLLNSQ